MSEEKDKNDKMGYIEEQLKPNPGIVMFGRVSSVCCAVLAALNVGNAISGKGSSATHICSAVIAGFTSIGTHLLTNAADRAVKFTEKLKEAEHLTKASEILNAR